MPAPVAPLSSSSAASSWATVRLKHLLSFAQMGSCSTSDLSLLASSSELSSPELASQPHRSSPGTSIVTRSDISNQESSVVLRVTERVVPSWEIPDTAPRAPAGSLLLVLGLDPGAVTACKIAGVELAVASSVAVLHARPEVNAQWLRYALLESPPAPTAPGVGVGLAALLQRKMMVPPRPDQDLIAARIEQFTANMRVAEEALRRHMALLSERRGALVRGFLRGDPSLISLAAGPVSPAAQAESESSTIIAAPAASVRRSPSC